MNKNSRRGIWIAVIAGVAVIALCMCVALVAFGGMAFFGMARAVSRQIETTQIAPERPYSIPESFSTQEPDAGEIESPGDAVAGKPTLGAQETMAALQNAQIPFADLRMQAMEFLNLESIPETVDFPGEFDTGDVQNFWVLNGDTNRYTEVKTVLAFESPHLYIWVEKGLMYDRSDLRRLGDEFEDKIYPTNREFFGSEWTPGIDQDEHLYLVYASGLGDDTAGMFSSADSIHPLAYSYSNGHETFFLNADTVILNEDFTYGVLAHEFQHMIHWYRDRNEETWLNEGFSELAAYLNGYDVGGFDFTFLTNPSTQLNYWSEDTETNAANYGGSFLFVNYFLERFGEKATQQLVGSPVNGFESIDQVLESLGATYPGSDRPYRANDLFADWTIANAVNDVTIDDGRYGYQNYQMPMNIVGTGYTADCMGGWNSGAVNQYGTNYIDLACSGQRTLQFEGAGEVDLLPEDPHSGEYAFWSNQGDESRMALSHQFDLSNVQGQVEMSYWTWYDIETDYDYLYLQASLDGENWTLLEPPACTGENPTGANYGCAYNGQSDDWIQETVDLSDYAGRQVWLRFVYLTDAAVNGEGMLLDDVAIPAIDYQTDFETDDGGWQSEGFARIQNRLPQSFRLALILKSDRTAVETLSWVPGETLEIPIDFDAYDQIILVVSGTTRFTRQPGDYRIQIKP